MTTSASSRRDNWSKHSEHRFFSTRGQRSLANISHPCATIDCGLIHHYCDINGADVGVLDIRLETTEPQGALLVIACVELEFQQALKAGPNVGHIHYSSTELDHSTHALKDDHGGLYKRFCLRYTAKHHLDEFPPNRRFGVMVVLEKISGAVVVSTRINATLRSWLPSTRIWRALSTYWSPPVNSPDKKTIITFNFQEKKSFASAYELYETMKSRDGIDEWSGIRGRCSQQRLSATMEEAHGP